MTNQSEPAISYVKDEEDIKNAASLIKEQVGPLTQQDIKAYQTVNEVAGKKEKLTAVLEIWKNQNNTEIILRKHCAYWILGALFVELICGNVAMFFIGFGMASISEWLAKIFFVGMYGQIITITLVVVRYLFPVPKKDSQTALFELVDKL
jgi:hypothetical protein